MKSKARKTNKRVAHVTEGSGNVFADLGLPNPEQELLKAQLTLQIYTILKDSGMTQVEIAKILGDRKSTRLNSSHGYISYAVFCLKKKKSICHAMVDLP